jgi:hypothetical protein
MLNSPAPSDQRAGVRPIAFVLQNIGGFGKPVTLKIRPEDLTRNEPSRVTVHQTLGRKVTGWVDNFGEGLPSVTISGHTGWRAGPGASEDGAASFDKLNNLVLHEYHAAKQTAINAGLDPALVKLLFIDMLNDFVWNVTPTTFQLRRSKSRPLLRMYNISLQAIATDIDNPFMVLPFGGSLSAGLAAFGRVVSFLRSIAGQIASWVGTAVAFKDKLLAPVAGTVASFAAMSLQVFDAVTIATSAINNGVNSTANSLIYIASDLAAIGTNIFRTLSAIEGIPAHTQAAISRVASAYNEVLCIFSNSLKPAKVYEDYTGLFGASNCSSTTGGTGPSQYANRNAFELMQDERLPVTVSTTAQSSGRTISNSDPVLAPIDIGELGRLVGNVTEGVSLQ